MKLNHEGEYICECENWEEPVLYPVAELIRCKECKHWDRKDGMFPDIDGNDWHGCEELSVYVSASGDAPCTPAWWYCANAKRREE